MLTIILLGVVAIGFAILGLRVYGIVLSFKKKWYIGVAALVVPLFAEIVAIAKLVFKKDLLA